MTQPINDNVIPFPDDRQRNPDDYAQQCPHCGSATFWITLKNRLRCFECEEFYEVGDD